MPRCFLAKAIRVRRAQRTYATEADYAVREVGWRTLVSGLAFEVDR